MKQITRSIHVHKSSVLASPVHRFLQVSTEIANALQDLGERIVREGFWEFSKLTIALVE